MAVPCDIQTDGVLWLINRVVFHPRGFALAVEFDDKGNAQSFQIQGRGDEPFVFTSSEDDEKFIAVERLFEAAKSGSRLSRSNADEIKERYE